MRAVQFIKALYGQGGHIKIKLRARPIVMRTRTARHLTANGGVAIAPKLSLCTVRDHNMFGGAYLRGKRIYK